MHSPKIFVGDEQNKKEWMEKSESEREIGRREEFFNKIIKRKIIKGNFDYNIAIIELITYHIYIRYLINANLNRMQWSTLLSSLFYFFKFIISNKDGQFGLLDSIFV